MYTPTPSPFSAPIWTADWSKYRTPALDWNTDWRRQAVNDFNGWWELTLLAIRYADAHKKEVRRQRNLRKYGLPIAA